MGSCLNQFTGRKKMKKVLFITACLVSYESFA